MGENYAFISKYISEYARKIIDLHDPNQIVI